MRANPWRLPFLIFWELLAVGFSPTVDRLGDPDFRTREAAHAAIRAAGAWAYPATVRGLGAASPEVAFRCRVLAARWDAAVTDAAAWFVLLAPAEPDPAAFDADWELRARVRRLMVRHFRVPDAVVWGLAPDELADPVARFFQERPYWADSQLALRRCRERARK